MASPSYKTFAYTVPAGGSVQIARHADFVTCLDASAPFKITFDQQPATEFEAGLTYNPETAVQLVELINEGASPNTIRMGFGKGGIQDSRLTIGNEVVTASRSPETFTTGGQISAANGATTALAAANSNRAEIVIANDGAGKIYVAGDAGAGAGEGVPIDAGGVLVLTTSAAVYARNDSGAAVPVSVAELERA